MQSHQCYTCIESLPWAKVEAGEGGGGEAESGTNSRLIQRNHTNYMSFSLLKMLLVLAKCMLENFSTSTDENAAIDSMVDCINVGLFITCMKPDIHLNMLLYVQ